MKKRTQKAKHLNINIRRSIFNGIVNNLQITTKISNGVQTSSAVTLLKDQTLLTSIQCSVIVAQAFALNVDKKSTNQHHVNRLLFGTKRKRMIRKT